MKVKKMTRANAHTIQSWTYEPPYDFYNQTPSEEGLEELMAYKAVHDQEELIGFFCLGQFAQVPNTTYTYSTTYTDIGCGMRPDLTGQGKGREFLECVMYEAERIGKPLRLTVATFNGRAIHLYGQAGFRTVASFERQGTTFQVMVRLS